MSAPGPIEEGAQARLTRTVKDLASGAQLGVGYTFTVEEFWTAGDPTADEIDVDFYYGSAFGGYNNVCVPADAVEVVKTAAQMVARHPPTARQILDGLDLLGDWDEFETNESEPDGTGTTVYGRTADGLPFGFTLHVTAIWETDL